VPPLPVSPTSSCQNHTSPFRSTHNASHLCLSLPQPLVSPSVSVVMMSGGIVLDVHHFLPFTSRCSGLVPLELSPTWTCLRITPDCSSSSGLISKSLPAFDHSPLVVIAPPTAPELSGCHQTTPPFCHYLTTGVHGMWEVCGTAIIYLVPVSPHHPILCT
jgi:hypothetical protein